MGRARRTMSVVKDNAGNPQYVISIVEDITRRKEVEQQPEALQIRLSLLLAEATSVGEIMPRVIQRLPMLTVLMVRAGFSTARIMCFVPRRAGAYPMTKWTSFAASARLRVETPGKPGGLN